MNLLNTIYIHLTSPTGEMIKLRADLVGARVENTRGTIDVWTQLREDGDSKVFTVKEDDKYITEALFQAHEFAKKQERRIRK